MRRLVALSTALLTVCALLVPSVAAAPPYTPETLTALLPAQSDLEAATDLTFVATQDLRQGADPVTVGRAYAVGNGTFISVHLFSRPDGAPPDAALRKAILDGTFLHESLVTTFNAIDRYESLPLPLSREADDVGASFLTLVRGQTFSVVADAFVRGNVYGIVIHSKTSANDVTTLRQTLNLLSAQLPR
jgi:hypothetical protein